MRKLVPLLVVALGLVACVPQQVNGPNGPISCFSSKHSMPIMGGSCMSAEHLVEWYESVGHSPVLGDVTIDELAELYLVEGAREGVRADVAFVQSVVETGWFRWGGQVEPEDHNYAGIGAVDGGSNPARFTSSRIGVRAQMQHLRAYADHKASRKTLHAPLVDPRFDLVQPKGKAPTVGDLSGTWASSKWYADTIVRIYGEALDHRNA